MIDSGEKLPRRCAVWLPFPLAGLVLARPASARRGSVGQAREERAQRSTPAPSAIASLRPEPNPYTRTFRHPARRVSSSRTPHGGTMHPRGLMFPLLILIA